jgi:hypothetical protein
VEHVEQFQRYLAARPLPSAKCYVDPALSRSDFTTPEEVNEVYRRRARFYDWSVNTYYLIGFRWWAYRRRAIAALQLGRCDRRGDWLRHRAQLRTGTGADRPDRTSAWRRSLRRYAGTGAQRVAARGWDNVELIRARATDFDFPARTPFPAGIVQGAVKSALGSSFGFQTLRQSTRSVTQLSLAIAAHTSNT